MAAPKTNDSDDTPILITSMEGHPFNSTDMTAGNLGVIVSDNKYHANEALEDLTEMAIEMGATVVTHFKLMARDCYFAASGNAWKKSEK